MIATLPASGAVEVDTTLLDDPANDVVISTADGQTSQPEGGNLKDVDLRSFGILAEDLDTVSFFVDVESLTAASQNPAPFGDPDYRIYFQYGTQKYRAAIDTVLDNPGTSAFPRESRGRLESEQGAGIFRTVVDGPVTLDFSANRASVALPRAAIVDQTQAALGLNNTLTSLWATAQSMGFCCMPVGQTEPGGDSVYEAGAPKAFDQVPNQMAGALPKYAMTTGELKSRGGLFAGSNEPIRWTNGEASTLVFQTSVTNTQDQKIDLAVSVKDKMPQWTVSFSDSISVPARSFVNVSFLVTIPFSHQHGSIHHFQAAFNAVNGNEFAAVDLGVYWPIVPQPAGHHDTLWLHSLKETPDNDFEGLFGSGLHGWFSAVEEEEFDDGDDISTQFVWPANPEDQKGVAFWRMYLEPGLRMGLDFRTEETGTAEIAINFPTTIVDPELEYRIDYAEVRQPRGRNDDGIDNAVPIISGSSGVIPGPVSGIQVFPLILDIEDAADEIAFKSGTNLILTLVLRATAIGGTMGNDQGANPALKTSQSVMQWPLNEYQEPIDTNFQTDGALELNVGVEGQSRPVNKGETTIYTFDMKYHSSTAGAFRVELSGTNLEWATLVGDTEFSMVPHAERRLGLAVTAPKSASSGERADITFRVIDVANAAVQAGITTVTMVDDSEDFPDEAFRITDLDKELTTSKDSPGLSLAILIGGLVALSRCRRQ
jgi:hypothetical protein